MGSQFEKVAQIFKLNRVGGALKVINLHPYKLGSPKPTEID
jgi:hypothetical protein